MKIKKIKLYDFDELSESAKQKAIENLSDCNVDHEWYEHIYSDAEEVGITLTTFEIERYCKGHFNIGALYTADKIIESHGKNCATYKDAVQFLKDRDALVKKYANGGDRVTEENEYQFDKDCDELEREFIDFLLGDYRMILKNEYEYLTSEEQIIESIKANGWTFTAEGKLEN